MLIKASRGAPQLMAQRTVLAGTVRMCVVSDWPGPGHAVANDNKAGDTRPHVATDISRCQLTGHGKWLRGASGTVQGGHCQPASLSASLSNVNSKCVSFETNPTPAWEKI